MTDSDQEEQLLHSTALQNVKSILQTRERAEEELLRAKEALETRARELARSLSTLRATFESTTDAVLVTGTQGEFVDCNDRLLQVRGFTRDRLASMDMADVWREFARQTVDPAGFLARLAEIEASGAEAFDQVELADGRLLERFTTIPEVDGVASGRVWTFHDVTERMLYEAALRSSHAQVSAIIDRSPVGILLIDATLRLIQVNPAARPMLERIDSMLGRDVEDVLRILWSEPIVLEFLEPLRATLETGETHALRGFTALRLDRDSPDHYDLEFHLLDLPEGRSGVACYVVDISDHVRAQQALRESDQRVRATFEQAALGMGVASPEGRFLHVNRKLAQLLGYAPEELCMRTFLDVTHPDDRAATRALARRLLAGEIDDYAIEKRYVRKDGTVLWVLTTVALMRTAEDEPESFVGLVEDITARRLAEERERENAQRMQLALSAGQLGDFAWDHASDVVTLGARAAEIFGVSAVRRITRRELLELVHPEDRPVRERAMEQALREGGDHEAEYRIRPPGSGERWIAVKGRVVQAAGRPMGMIGVVQDVTERKKLELARQRLAALVEFSDDAIVGKDLDGIVRTWNGGAERLFGYRAEEIVGTSITRLIPPELRDEEKVILSRLRRGERIHHFETVRLAKDGRRIDISLTISPILDASGRIVGASKIARDITARRQAEAEVRRSEEELRSLVDSIPHLAWMAHPDGSLFWFNRGWFEYTGTTLEQVQGSGWLELLEPSFQPHASEQWQASVRSGDPFEMECPLRGADGRFRAFLTRARPLRDEDGTIQRWFGTNTDVEEVRRAREERQQLLEAERSARAEAERVSFMKDEFLATLSHELRTPLNAIVGWSHVLRSQGHANAEVLEGLSVIDRNAKIQAQLIEDLLDMSRIVSGKVRLDVQPVDLPDVVRAAIASMRHSAEAKGIEVQVALDPRAGPVRGDPGRLQQCFWNLLSNAIKFTPRGGRVRVSLAPMESQVEFSVEDDGQGISTEFMPHVFERFRQADASTTRRHGGLGLGLAIVKNLVELHGGTVRASSPGVGRGATFAVELPVLAVSPEWPGSRTAVASAEKAVGSVPERPSLEGITVLMVDDEPDARSLVKRVLEDCGARVLVAESTQAGLELLLREKPNLLISDIGMPVEDGYAFIRQVRMLEPERGGRTPAAALSAFARPEDRTRALRAGYQMHLSKPVDPSELTAVVASLAVRP